MSQQDAVTWEVSCADGSRRHRTGSFTFSKEQHRRRLTALDEYWSCGPHRIVPIPSAPEFPVTEPT